ncbi:MAG TPA: glutamine-hydrolyzing GMP synthase [Terracidiphilus sp.]|nr:glutamine-hydrolyzing GMP synthase [Terracidiphilus sp.]
MDTQTIVILDFGSQYTQLIARRIREQNVFCVVLPCTAPLAEIQVHKPIGVILSGGPSSVYDADAPAADPDLLNLDAPILGICYGLHFIVHHMGGRVVTAPKREYGHAEVTVEDRSTRLFTNLPGEMQVWMSHGDEALELPAGFHRTAVTANALAGIANEERRIWAVQFHPEVHHTPLGPQLLRNFVFSICGARGDWTPAHFIETTVAAIREKVGAGHVICGLSGGVDSSVAAVLVHKAIGNQLTCIFVNNGVLRKNEFDSVQKNLRDKLGLNIVGVDASERFLAQLAGVTDPETKRKRIGAEFIAVFDDEANRIAKETGGVDWLVQGTLYPDVIESSSVKGPSQTIKSHHNVGGLPERMKLKLIEPLRDLFKDEVRRIGRDLGMPEDVLGRQPFPGPGLAVRILGEVTADRVALLQEADEIVVAEIKAAGLYAKVWQSFAVLLPVMSVGVMGDQRTYAYTCAVRAVHSEDGMTADWAPLPHEVLKRISSRIVNEVRGINRVVYDITSKPPGTIEWE